MSSYTEHWLMTPILGEIKNCTIVILCDPISKNNVKCKIYNNNDHIDDLDIEISKCGATRIIINLPEDGTYTLIWEQDDNVIFFHTVTVKNHPDQMIFVSCDLLEADTKFSMWNHMYYNLLRGTNNYLIHIGDQAYLDKVFKEGVKRAKTAHDDPEAIIKSFRDRYYETWMPHADLLASVSNYCLWDDHEIVNNIILTDELDEDEQYVTGLAVNAYSRYQECLHLEENLFLSEHSWFRVTDDTMMAAIERTSRKITMTETLISLAELLVRYNPTRVILCFSAPVIPGPSGRYGQLYRKFTGDKGTLETSKFLPTEDLAQLYRTLFHWMEAGQHREAVVIGGDLHFGVKATVTRGLRQIQVAIASPITNQPTFDRWLAAKGLQDNQLLSDGTHPDDDTYPLIFKPISARARRCYVTLNTNVYPMSLDINYSSEKYAKSNIKYLRTLLSFA